MPDISSFFRHSVAAAPLLVLLLPILLDCCGSYNCQSNSGHFRKIPERVNKRIILPVAPKPPKPVPVDLSQDLELVGCNSSSSAVKGSISSPNFPKPYRSNEACFYRIALKNQNLRIRITFIEFDTESGHDWIKVLSGKQEKMLTGSKLPGAFVTETWETLILFHSDEDVEGKGFLLRFSATSAEASKLDVMDSCGSVIWAPMGTIATPNYPHNYTNNLRCRWTVKGPEGAMVRVTARRGMLATEMRHDVIQLSNDQHDGSGPLLATLSGHAETDSVVISPQNILHVDFTTDESVTDRGFQLEFLVIPQNISTTVLHQDSGVLQSANYPVDYPINQALTWIIHGSESGTNLRIIDLELDKSSRDYLLIGRGEDVNNGVVSTLIGTLHDNSAYISIPDNRTFFLHFHSHHHVKARRGWIVAFEPFANPTFDDNLLQLGKHLLTDPSSKAPFKKPKIDSRKLTATASQATSREELLPTMAVNSALPSLTSYAVRGAATYSETANELMEIDVEPFHPKENWQGDLRQCLGSMLPRNLFRSQRVPSFTTTIVQSENNDVVRVMIATTEGAGELVEQLRSTLSMGKVRCNDSLEMYLPNMLSEVQAVNGQNWLLASICIIAFFLITFSAVLFVHCKHRRRIIVRKLKPMSSPNVVMEPTMQRNPLYELKRSDSKHISVQTVSTPKSPRRTRRTLSVVDEASETSSTPGSCTKITCTTSFTTLGISMEEEGVVSKAPDHRIYPHLLRGKNAGGTVVISQNIPSITQGYNRRLDIILEPTAEDIGSVKSVSATSEDEYEFETDCQLEADCGEILESCDQALPESYTSLFNDWRNGKPMTVRAVKQKNLLKKQIKKDGFEEEPAAMMEEGERYRDDFSELYCDFSSEDGSASSFDTESETSVGKPQTALKGITLPERPPTGRMAVQPVPRLDPEDDSSSASGTSEEDIDEDSDDDLAEFIVADKDASENEGGHNGINFHFDLQPHCMHDLLQDYDPSCHCITQYLPTESDDSRDFSNYY